MLSSSPLIRHLGFAPIIIMLLSPSLLNFDLAKDDPERVIIYASSEPAIVRAQRLGVDSGD